MSPTTKKNESKPQPVVRIPTPDTAMEEESDGGAIRISENVIAAVVRKYTREVDGVIRFASGSIVGGLAEMIGKKNYESSLVVDLDEELVNITVSLVLRFGVRIPDVCEIVQDVIRTRVEELTGKTVTRVNVIVQDLEEVEEEKPAEAVGREE